METMPSTAPSTCCPHSSVRRDQGHPSLTRGTLVGFAHIVAAVNVTFPLPVTLISPWLQSTNLLMTFFFNVIQQSDNYDRLTLEEVSFLLPIFLDEDVFINLSKWSASRIGIAQLNPMLCVLEKLPS